MAVPTLLIRNLSLRISGSSKPILHEINYAVNSGDFVILLGSNGSGKSSLLKVIDRRYPVTAGEIKILGKNSIDYSAVDFCRQVITITQNCLESLFPTLTVLENCVLAKLRLENKLFTLGIKKKERQYFQEYLGSYSQNLGGKLNVKVAALSGGEQQALILALSILAKPKLLLLDEHTSALDPKAAAHLMQITAKIVHEHQITCLLCTHDLTVAMKYGNRILALHHGKIIRNIEAEEKANILQDELLQACYVK